MINNNEITTKLSREQIRPLICKLSFNETEIYRNVQEASTKAEDDSKTLDNKITALNSKIDDLHKLPDWLACIPFITWITNLFFINFWYGNEIAQLIQQKNYLINTNNQYLETKEKQKIDLDNFTQSPFHPKNKEKFFGANLTEFSTHVNDVKREDLDSQWQKHWEQYLLLDANPTFEGAVKYFEQVVIDSYESSNKDIDGEQIDDSEEKNLSENELLNQQINSNENFINEGPLNEISDESEEEIKTDEDESEKLPLDKASDESKKKIKKYSPELPENLPPDLKERCEKIAEEYFNTKTIQFSLNNDERQEQILAIMILLTEGNMRLFSNNDLDLLKKYANFTQNIEKYNFLYPSKLINKIEKLPPRGEWIEENIQTSNTELIILFFLKEFESLDSKDRPKFDEGDYKNYQNIYFRLNNYKADTLIMFVDQNNNPIEHGVDKKEMTLSCNFNAISKYFTVPKALTQNVTIENGMNQIRVIIREQAQEQHVVHLVRYLERLNHYYLSYNRQIDELIEIFCLFNYLGMDNESFTSELFSCVSKNLGDFFPRLFPLACKTNNQFLLEHLVPSMFNYAAISKENFEVVEKLLKESKWSMKKLNLKNRKSELMIVNDTTLSLLEHPCFQDIEHLSMELNYNITDKGINYILGLKNLCSLDLRCPEITGSDWKKLPDLTKLISLKLVNCRKLKNQALENIGKCHSLKELSLEDSGTDLVFDEYRNDRQAQFDNEALKNLSSLIHLEHLNLNNNSLLDRETLSYLVENLKNLRSLELVNCFKVTEGYNDLNSVRENVLDGFKQEKLSSVWLTWIQIHSKIRTFVTKELVKESGKWELKNQ